MLDQGTKESWKMELADASNQREYCNKVIGFLLEKLDKYEGRENVLKEINEKHPRPETFYGEYSKELLNVRTNR